MNKIISDFFINATIIISFVTFSNHFFKDDDINSSSPLHKKIIAGLVSGILGCILMLYSIRVAQNIIMDFRYIPIIIMALYFSFESAIVAALLIGVFRLFYFGVSLPSIIAFIIAIIVGIGSGIIGKQNIKIATKWIFSVILTCIVFIIAIIMLIKNSPILVEILISFCVGTSLVSIGVYYLLEYTNSSNEKYRQMKLDTRIDFLTNLNNVRQFDYLLNKALTISKDKNEGISLLFIDIDFFKKINDKYGHIEGDETLKQLAQILSKTSRSFDIVSRNGGEEFSVILVDCNMPLAIDIAENIRKAIEQHEFVLTSGKKIHITVSIGVSSFPDTTIDPEKLVEQSDIALYKAKRNGRNRVETA